MTEPVIATAPGRVNLIGDHVDYAGGCALPIAIDRAVTLLGERGGAEVVLSSDEHPGTASLALDVADVMAVEPPWARLAAGVVAELGPRTGLRGRLSSTLPSGAGLSSSAAVEVAIALALLGSPAPTGRALIDLAHRCRLGEQRAVGVPCGVLDQLASLGGVADHALLIDFAEDTIEPVRLPDGARLALVDSGERRQLETSVYADRRREVDAAASVIGPLREATIDAIDGITDPVLRRRARHVVTEIARVHAVVDAFRAGDLVGAGREMSESHSSLRDDHEVSTPRIDRLVADLERTDGVHGARLTGGGWGGFVVILTDPDSTVGTTVQAANGATVRSG